MILPDAANSRWVLYFLNLVNCSVDGVVAEAMTMMMSGAVEVSEARRVE